MFRAKGQSRGKLKDNLRNPLPLVWHIIQTMMTQMMVWIMTDRTEGDTDRVKMEDPPRPPRHLGQSIAL